MLSLSKHKDRRFYGLLNQYAHETSKCNILFLAKSLCAALCNNFVHFVLAPQARRAKEKDLAIRWL